ncbi:MAG: beta-lactamase family protein [Bacteroidales bacterium]|jgi:CubicO group peptidase (beta-lactamase class C family)|nr:beta-lactamase family protein [Bacteroidales bacterium]
MDKTTKRIFRINHMIICLIGSLAFSSCLKDEPFKSGYEGFKPKKIDDDWERSSLEAEKVNESLIEQAYRLINEDDRYKMARSLLVFRNGKLIAEAYPEDKADIHRIHHIQSVTKSITSILTGIAMQNGDMTDPDEKLYAIFPEYFDNDDTKRDISIRDALCMQTGLLFDNDKHTKKLYHSSHSVTYVLSLPKVSGAGTEMLYNDGAPHLISKAIESKSGKTLEQYASEHLFSVLGITDWLWESAEDGTTFGAFGLYLKPRDLGKIGQLLLQNGKWGEVQLIDPGYLQEATREQAIDDADQPYGYYFWILPDHAYYALGHGGQFLLVSPEKSLVVVYTAWPYSDSRFFDEPSELMDLIIESCED